MKVLLVNNFLSPNYVGGAEVSVGNLSKYLQSAGVKVASMSLAESDISAEHISIDYPFLKRIWTKNKKRTFLDRLLFQFVSEKFNFLYKRRLIKEIKDINPDVIHTNNLAGIGSVIWKVAHELNIPVVHTLRDYYQICARQTFYANGENCIASKRCESCKLLTAGRKVYSQAVTIVVGNSKKTLDLHIESGFFSNAEKHVISGGLNDDFGSGNTQNADRENALRVGFIGQIILTKGVEVFLEIASLNPDKKFIIAGDGPIEYVERLKDNYRLDNITWLGRSDAREFFRSIDILVVPSLWHEPLARVLYEAYSFGVPVIASDVGGNSDVLIGDQRQFLFTAGDILSASEKLNIMAEMIKSQKIDHSDLILISKQFTSRSVAEKYTTIYQSVLKSAKEGDSH